MYSLPKILPLLLPLAFAHAQSFDSKNADLAGLIDYAPLHDIFLEKDQIAFQFHGLPLPSNPSLTGLTDTFNWAYLTERHLLLHLVKPASDGASSTSYLYTFVTPNRSINLDSIKDGKQRLAHFEWILADWVAFEEVALFTSDYEFRSLLNPTLFFPFAQNRCDIYYSLFGLFRPNVGSPPSNPFSPGLWDYTKWQRCSALANMLADIDLYISLGGFNWDIYPDIKVVDCLYRHKAADQDFFSLIPFATDQTPYLYSILRDAFVYRQVLVTESPSLPVAVTDFDAQSNYALIYKIEDQITSPRKLKPWKDTYGINGRYYVHSWAYVTSRNCIVHVAVERRSNFDVSAWTFTLVSLEMVDVNAIRNGSKKIKDFQWAISGGVFYAGIDDGDHAYISSRNEPPNENDELFFRYGHTLNDLMKFRKDLQDGKNDGVEQPAYILALLNHVADPHTALLQGFQWPSADDLNDVILFDVKEDASKQQFEGNNAVTTFEKFYNEGGNDDTYAEVFFFHPDYTPYKNRTRYHSLAADPTREFLFNLYKDK
ncbi:MAG: hypothetical protein LBU03_04905 [Tannerellaceae bacterium]|nr:hypothetical protein [Tannerellaceae bacterium]